MKLNLKMLLNESFTGDIIGEPGDKQLLTKEKIIEILDEFAYDHGENIKTIIFTENVGINHNEPILGTYINFLFRRINPESH